VLSEALAARTPVPGLFLTGQDVMTPASLEPLRAACSTLRRSIRESTGSSDE
jgi:hypothetical protein